MNPIRVCEVLVGLGGVNVVGVDDEVADPIRVHVETRRIGSSLESKCAQNAPRVYESRKPSLGAASFPNLIYRFVSARAARPGAVNPFSFIRNA
jgi:hypothetical protein